MGYRDHLFSNYTRLYYQCTTTRLNLLENLHLDTTYFGIFLPWVVKVFFSIFCHTTTITTVVNDVMSEILLPTPPPLSKHKQLVIDFPNSEIFHYKVCHSKNLEADPSQNMIFVLDSRYNGKNSKLQNLHTDGSL